VGPRRTGAERGARPGDSFGAVAPARLVQESAV